MDRHPSQRGWFAAELHEQMEFNPDIYLIVGDLGYKVFDKIQKDFPERFINCGASEQAGVGIAVGLALQGKIPFLYSITPFVIFRAFETLRNYINHEKINVKLVGAGRDKDYEHDGFSHWAEDVNSVIGPGTILSNIQVLTPKAKEDLADLVPYMIKNDNPQFLSLTR